MTTDFCGTRETFRKTQELGARLRGRTATQRSKKGSVKVLRGVSGSRVLRRVLRTGFAVGFAVKEGSEKGSQKGFREGVFQKVLRTPLCRVRPFRRVP